MMDNNNHWKDILKECVKYPDGLSNVEERLENRIKKGKRKGKGIISSITAAAAAVVSSALEPHPASMVIAMEPARTTDNNFFISRFLLLFFITSLSLYHIKV